MDAATPYQNTCAYCAWTVIAAGRLWLLVYRALLVIRGVSPHANIVFAFLARLPRVMAVRRDDCGPLLEGGDEVSIRLSLETSVVRALASAGPRAESGGRQAAGRCTKRLASNTSRSAAKGGGGAGS